ncbi:unnamed protein product [Umbelopsis ramanniana]
MKNSRIFLASVLALSATITVNAQQQLSSSEEITTVWQTVVEYKTAPEDMSANPTASVSEIDETATGADLTATGSAMQPVKTGAPETVDGDADADTEVDPEAEVEVNEDAENDEAAPSASATKKSPNASAGKPKATSAPADEAGESSAAEEASATGESSAAAENSGAAEVVPTASQSAAADQSLAAGESADEDKPVASAVSTGDAPSATPSGASEGEEVVPGFPAALLPNANGDIEGIAAESSAMSAPVVATALPSLTALASGRASMSASASGMRPSISLKDMSASAAGSSPTGAVHSAASKVTFAGVSVAAIAFAGLLLL